MATIIKQGDAYSLPVALKLNGKGIAAADIDTVEFCIGGTIRKLYPDVVAYDEQGGFFYVPLEQGDTFALPADEPVSLDARVKFINGSVKGVQRMAYISVVDATSEVVL